MTAEHDIGAIADAFVTECSGRVTVGSFCREKRFVRWPMTQDNALQRVETAWDALEREPDIGDISWFAPADYRSE